MKETLATQSTQNYAYANNGEANHPPASNGNARRYAMLSAEWVSCIGEELGMHPLPDSLLRRLAEDASYRLREVLHKCVTRLRHSKRKRLTGHDVDAVVSTLCDADPIVGAPSLMAEFHSEARVFVPHDRLVELARRVNEPPNITQENVPFLRESEVCDEGLIEARLGYAKRALRTLFHGSQKTFQVLLNDCSTNPQLGGEGVVDRLMSIARSTVISNNAQYTRVTARTCQLIVAVAGNSEAVYPYHLNSVDKLTELLLELLLGDGFVNAHLEPLFKECALKLALRWPSVADKYVPVLTSVLVKEENVRKRTTAMELLACLQPLVFFDDDACARVRFNSALDLAVHGSHLWHRLALAICALSRSESHSLSYETLSEHFGDSLLLYLPAHSPVEPAQKTTLPFIVRSKIKYANVRAAGKTLERQPAFPDSTLRGPREIRFAFAGGRPVPSNNLRRTSLRANYQILRGDVRASFAHVASRRLLVLGRGRKRSYDLARCHL